ncbi:DUF1702 family protein [Actinoplanes sp. G11-F43]|uniref:DUF1702 family protein n=1 Tax=Actinoplanes sp. G11-F43 TaxID=3424130 RepID=UPI003D32F22A
MKAWRMLRRAVLTPNRSATKVDVRGFHVKSESARELFEKVGDSFLDGYAAAAGATRNADITPELSGLSTQFRGFAFEGAAMAYAIRDALHPLGGRLVARYLAGPGDPHLYMAYVGVGWAMARLPRARWSTLHAPDPVLKWLVLDGYGFHQTYFRTSRYAHGQQNHARFPWPAGDRRGYATRAIDQGIGRAMWFVAGGDVTEVTRRINGFAEPRRADLWSGTGLAASYAGSVGEEDLARLRRSAGRYAPDLAQGSAFAAGARVRAGLVVPHTDLATGVLCGMTAAEASAVTDEELPSAADDAGETPAYEIWRTRVARRLTSRVGS